MDAVIIEINQNIWRLLHVKGSFNKPKIIRHIEISGKTCERASAVSEYISSNKLSGVGLGIVLPRDCSISRILEIPAPNSTAIRNILNFEIEKHLPLPPSEMYYGHQVIGRKGNSYSVFIGASLRKKVDEILDTFASAKIKPSFVYLWQEALLNSLFYFEKIEKTCGQVFINIEYNEIAIDFFSGLLPAYSKRITSEAAPENMALTVKKEIRDVLAYSGRKLDDLKIVFIKNPGRDILYSIEKGITKNFSILDFKSGLEPAGMIAFGGALAILDMGKVNINLLPGAESKSIKISSFVPLIIFIFLASLTAISYIAEDILTIRRLDSSISELNKLKEKSKSGDKFDSSSRIKALESVSKNSAHVLDLLKELTEILPDNSWLTSLEFRDGTVVIEGMSGDAPSLLILLEKSRLMRDFEFAAPVVRTSKGEEKFRIKARISDEKGR